MKSLRRFIEQHMREIEMKDGVSYKPIPGYPNYMVGEDGTVWSNRKKGVSSMICGWWQMNPVLDSKGYYFVNLFMNKSKKAHRVHSLVAEAFIGVRPVGADVRHLDDVKTNNHISNLCYGTRKENFADLIRNGKSNKGSRHGMSRLTESDVIKIIASLAAGETQRSIASRYGVGQQTIGDINLGRSWSHITRGSTCD